MINNTSEAQRSAKMSQLSPKPYRIEFSDEMLRDLRERLSRTRWPEVPPQEPWATGTSIAYMRDLVDYWRDPFGWRAHQERPQRCQKIHVPAGGIEPHFFHQEGKGPKPGSPPPSS